MCVGGGVGHVPLKGAAYIDMCVVPKNSFFIVFFLKICVTEKRV